MNKYMVICFIFVQSSIIMGAEKSVKRASAPNPGTVAQGLPIPQQKKNHRLTPEKRSLANSPWEFSPNSMNSGIVYYSGAFGALDEQDFSPISHSKK